MTNQLINIYLDRALWRLVSIRCAELGVAKRVFVMKALREALKRSEVEYFAEQE